MGQEEEKKFEKSSPKVLWIVVTVIVIAAIALVAWFFTRATDSEESTTSTETEQVTAKAPKHADWQSYTSAKYGFTMYYPQDYTLAESAVGTVILSKGSTEMVDLYVSVASSSEDSVKKEIAAYMDDTRGYMTGASEVDTTATTGAIEATMVTGIFGSKAAINPHTGTKGSSIFFVKNGNLFALDSFYNDNTEDFFIFEDIVKDIRF